MEQQKQKTSRREWVKTFAIIFLVILLILTFFSNTIMNRSLPEVATQAVTSGAINAKIRGTGTVSANETYDVTINQTRKIRSVLVKVGDQVAAGDTLFLLEASESDELQQAQQALEDMELNYQKSLIDASNSASTENREVQKLQEAYNEALETYRLYSTADPSQIALALEKAKVTLTDLQRAYEDAQEELNEASSDSAYAEAQQAVSDAEAAVSQYQAQIETAESQLDQNLPTSLWSINSEISSANSTLTSLNRKHDQAVAQYDSHKQQTVDTGKGTQSIGTLNTEYLQITGSYAELCAENVDFLMDFMRQTLEDETLVTEEYARALQTAYKKLTEDQAIIDQALQNISAQEAHISALENQREILNTINKAESDLSTANTSLFYAQRVVEEWDSSIKDLQQQAKDAQRSVEDQQALVDKYTQASIAAETLKAAEEALEDKVFTVNLGDAGSLDLQAAKKAIEDQRALIEELTADADGQEITADVSGVISAINYTAGNTAGAETVLATITVADRGYTVKIAVTNEQAQQVKIGDTASISNYYYGGLTATLENIINDPQNLGKGKLLVFRLSGDDVEAGSNLTLSIGQKSANYDAIVPNSAIRTDANGDFVLVVTAKSSPLGNRYVATRADVQKLAADDTTTAVSGLANGDFVITTSSKPLEAGDQVRLVDNG